jgi:hypothetical protein
MGAAQSNRSSAAEDRRSRLIARIEKDRQDLLLTVDRYGQVLKLYRSVLEVDRLPEKTALREVGKLACRSY